jgi:hypothetical protein
VLRACGSAWSLYRKNPHRDRGRPNRTCRPFCIPKFRALTPSRMVVSKSCGSISRALPIASMALTKAWAVSEEPLTPRALISTPDSSTFVSWARRSPMSWISCRKGSGTVRALTRRHIQVQGIFGGIRASFLRCRCRFIIFAVEESGGFVLLLICEISLHGLF